MDYRKILVAYIAHVGREEGTDFLGAPIAGLTGEENALLCEASAETGTGAWREDRLKKAQEFRDNVRSGD